MDSPTTDRVKSDGTAAEEKVSDILEAISQASARTISGLKATLKPQSLHRAVGLLDRAGATCIIGNGDTFPVAALLTNGLNDRGRVCKIFGPYGSVMEHEILSLGPDDLLVLIELPGDRLPENILADARARKVPRRPDSKAEPAPWPATWPWPSCCLSPWIDIAPLPIDCARIFPPSNQLGRFA